MTDIKLDYIKPWLEKFLRERIHPQIFLDFNSNFWIIKLYQSKKYIRLKINLELYKLGSNKNLYFKNINLNRYFKLEEKFALPIPISNIQNDLFILEEEEGFLINEDVLGFLFRMLSRCEEVNPSVKDIDKHKRFKAISTEAYKNNFLDIPVVDLWIEQLIRISKNLWAINIKRNNYKICPSHDVDRPSLYLYSKRNLVYELLLKLYKKDINSFKSLIPNFYKSSKNLQCEDPFNTFDWLIENSNKNNLQSCFYFMSGSTSFRYDTGYNIRSNSIKNLLKKISDNGHLIGLHPSYGTYLNQRKLKKEYNNLLQLLNSLNIKTFAGVRMHFLRYSIPETPNILENLGILFDSTLGFPDKPGFRCGTSYEFQMFDPVNQRPLKLRQKPLIMMENTILPSEYSNLSLKESKLVMKDLLNKCKEHNGNFTMLWHNCQFIKTSYKDIYLELINS